jgi:hypothetical protein
MFAQDPEIISQTEEENISATEDTDENDDRLQQLHVLRKNPLDLNLASADELQILGLNPIQSAALIEHRKRFGDLIAIQELQAVEGWNLQIIRAVLPYIKIGQTGANRIRIKDGWKKGTHFLLLRSARTLETSKGFQVFPAGKEYQGSPQKMLLRYQYKSVAGIQSGFTAEKDAGEMMFGDRMTFGFDFTSAHFHIHNVGLLQSLVLGDYKIQLGQGLMLWQGNGFRKGAGSLLVKRQGPLLLPYTGSGEYLFSRGIAAVWGWKQWRLLTFHSVRRMTATLEVNQSGEQEITTVIQSGLYRSVSESNKKNNAGHSMSGMSVRYQFNKGHISLSTLQHLFSFPFAKGTQPYSSFDFTGNRIRSASVDYSYTRNNFHVSGEWAIDQSGKVAIVNSIMLALDSKVDLVLLHRHYQRAYSSFQSNAFADRPVPQNEAGLYAGLALRPEKAWQIDAYADLALFPWLKFRTDAPSFTTGYSLLVRYVPSRIAEWYVRLRNEMAELNSQSDFSGFYSALQPVSRTSSRLHIALQLTREWALRQRFELTRIKSSEDAIGKYGSMFYLETFYKPPSGDAGYNFRIMLFNTDGYDARIYAYEQDVLFNASVPASDGKGIRYYFNTHRKFHLLKNKSGWKADVYLKWSQTIYADKKIIGSGLDEIAGNKKSEIKIQLLVSSQ